MEMEIDGLFLGDHWRNLLAKYGPWISNMWCISPGSLLEKQKLRPQPRPIESESTLLTSSQVICMLFFVVVDLYAFSSLRSIGLR